MSEITYTATYSPEDNKIRLSASARLPKELYDRVRAAGFIWAPRQEIFVAPMWTPSRARLAEELAGEIGDEDTTLVERAEERADRFNEYSDNRTADAHNAREAVESIAGNIPFGQPILVGHHSEARARRDAEKIESGMRRAVKLWSTAEYWTRRAAGALRHAKYKELPAVRARRIKGIEADLRKVKRIVEKAWSGLKLWEKVTTWQQSKTIANYDSMSFSFSLADYPRAHPKASTYEGAMSLWSALGDAEGEGIIGFEKAKELATAAHLRTTRGYDSWIQHYENRLVYERAMLGESGGLATDKTGPEKGGACKCWASHRGGWSWIVKVNKVSVSVLDNWGNPSDADGGRNFKRIIPFDKLSGVMTVAQVEEKRAAGLLEEYADKTGFFLRDTPAVEVSAPVKDEGADAFKAMAQSLKAGVQVVSANQLFPTPADVARRLVELADIEPGHDVLEPSAGTGAILRELPCVRPGSVTAVEISTALANLPAVRDHADTTHAVDFLEWNTSAAILFDRIVMNPPFENASDIKHVLHARQMLKPGGKLAAIVANGPRQREALQSIVADWIDLEPGAFKASGTNVNTAMILIEN